MDSSLPCRADSTNSKEASSLGGEGRNVVIPGGPLPPSDGIDRRVRSRKKVNKSRIFLFATITFFGDILLWLLLYLGISSLMSWHNMITSSAVLIPMAVIMLSLALVGGYRFRTDFASLRYASEHLIASGFAYLVAAFILYVVASFGAEAASSRGIFSVTILLFALASLMIRRAFWFTTAQWRQESKVLAIVDRELGRLFYHEYQANRQHQRVEYLAADLSLLGQRIAGEDSPILRVEAAHLLPQLRSENIQDYEAVVVASRFSHLDSRVIERLGSIHFEEMPVYLMETFYETYWNKFPVELLGPAWPLETDFLLVQHSVYTNLKRLIDFLVALLVLVIAAPVMLLTALAVVIMDGLPVTYSQPRTGLHGNPFTLYKFRSMKVGSDKGDGYTREGDSRVSRLGSFLRKTRLDELPQLWNVLRGDMSMIGPRAEWVRLVSEYEKQIPHYHFRHLVRPGITGWAQVNYPYGASLEDTIQKFSYDLYYIRNFSIRLDAEVILKTIHIMSFGKGR